MLFWVVSGVGRGMGVLNGGDRRWRRAVLGVNVVRPIVTNGDGDALFPNYFGEDLFDGFGECQTSALERRRRLKHPV